MISTVCHVISTVYCVITVCHVILILCNYRLKEEQISHIMETTVSAMSPSALPVSPAPSVVVSVTIVTVQYTVDPGH